MLLVWELVTLLCILVWWSNCTQLRASWYSCMLPSRSNGVLFCTAASKSSTFYFGGPGIFSPKQYQLSLYTYYVAYTHAHCSIKQWRRRLSACEENLGIARTFVEGHFSLNWIHLLSEFRSHCLCLGQMRGCVRSITGRHMCCLFSVHYTVAERYMYSHAQFSRLKLPVQYSYTAVYCYNYTHRYYSTTVNDVFVQNQKQTRAIIVSPLSWSFLRDWFPVPQPIPGISVTSYRAVLSIPVPVLSCG